MLKNFIRKLVLGAKKYRNFNYFFLREQRHKVGHPMKFCPNRKVKKWIEICQHTYVERKKKEKKKSMYAQISHRTKINKHIYLIKSL